MLFSKWPLFRWTGTCSISQRVTLQTQTKCFCLSSVFRRHRLYLTRNQLKQAVTNSSSASGSELEITLQMAPQRDCFSCIRYIKLSCHFKTTYFKCSFFQTSVISPTALEATTQIHRLQLLQFLQLCLSQSILIQHGHTTDKKMGLDNWF